MRQYEATRVYGAIMQAAGAAMYDKLMEVAADGLPYHLFLAPRWAGGAVMSIACFCASGCIVHSCSPGHLTRNHPCYCPHGTQSTLCYSEHVSSQNRAIATARTQSTSSHGGCLAFLTATRVPTYLSLPLPPLPDLPDPHRSRRTPAALNGDTRPGVDAGPSSAAAANGAAAIKPEPAGGGGLSAILGPLASLLQQPAAAAAGGGAVAAVLSGLKQQLESGTLTPAMLEATVTQLQQQPHNPAAVQALQLLREAAAKGNRQQQGQQQGQGQAQQQGQGQQGQGQAAANGGSVGGAVAGGGAAQLQANGRAGPGDRNDGVQVCTAGQCANGSADVQGVARSRGGVLQFARAVTVPPCRCTGTAAAK